MIHKQLFRHQGGQDEMGISFKSCSRVSSVDQDDDVDSVLYHNYEDKAKFVHIKTFDVPRRQAKCRRAPHFLICKPANDFTESSTSRRNVRPELFLGWHRVHTRRTAMVWDRQLSRRNCSRIL